MDPDPRLQDLSPYEVLHERLMWEIVQRVQDTGYILKGGCALVFAYGSRRRSTDLDFDARKRTGMTRRIWNGLRAVEAEPAFHGQIPSEEALRIRVWYRVRGADEPVELKVDTRFRPRPVAAEVTFVDGIRTYKPEALFKQKLATFGDRKQPRDLSDLAFLATQFGHALTDAQVRQSEQITRRMNKLERYLGLLIEEDPVLSCLTTAADTQIRRRGLRIQHQRLPVS